MRIQDMMRSSGVKRWTIVTTSRDESIAEHSFLVALLASEIAERATLSTTERNHVVLDAMYHDMHEVQIGDIPTPAKKKGYVTVHFPTEANIEKWSPYSAKTEEVVSYADLIQSWWFISQWGTGRHAEEVARHVYLRLLKKFEKNNPPTLTTDIEAWDCRICGAAYQVFHELQHAPHEV